MSLVRLGPYEMVKKDDWVWPHFSPYELRHRPNGQVVVDMAFLDKIEDLRVRVGFPLGVSSYYRSPEYNAQVSSTGLSGPHTTGLAIDLLVSGQNAHHLLSEALKMGFTGIGISQKGSHKSRFIHLDTLGGDLRPRVWSY